MAFGISKEELTKWKENVLRGEITYLTHFWVEPRFPDIKTVTKVGCSNLSRLKEWCLIHGLNAKYIHYRVDFPHFDLMGPKQKEILLKEKQWEQIKRFGL